MAQYPGEFIDRLHLVWGAGFLSPGGPEEVCKIVEGLDLSGKRILDIGCGAGGPAMVLAQNFGAHMVCLDVEQELVDRARLNFEKEGLSGFAEFHLVEPGPLPFNDDEIDGVFSKEAILHIPDKSSLFSDVLRILKPGGFFAASDWLKGENAETDPGYLQYISKGHLDYRMATARETEAALNSAGFCNVSTLDRHEWYAPKALEELVQIQGPLKEKLIAISGQETYDEWLSSRNGSSAAFNSGGLRPTHLRAFRPLA